jgi:AAA domain
VNPSLSIKASDERVLLNCQGGCHTQDVVLALGLDWPDLFDDNATGSHTVASWTYQDRVGNPYFVVERIQKPTGKVFAQKMPDAIKYGLPAGFKPCLYKMPQLLAAIEAGEEVWIVEGEKCVAAAESLGVVATTNPMGAGKWRDYYAKWFTEGRGCSGVNIVCDNDEAGRQHAAAVAVSLRGVGVPVRTYAVALDGPKADLYDHVQAGYGLDDLRPVKLNRLRASGFNHHCLITTDYPPVRWAVKGLLPTGFSILGGPPKMAKSMCALDMALGVASGGRAMSELECEQGSVLYLSLDNDSERRLAYRAHYLLGPDPADDLPIEYHCDWPTGDTAIQHCQEWIDDELDSNRAPLLVVVDTLARVEPNFEGGGYDNAYLASTSTLARWSKFANDNDVAVLAIHHDRKRGNSREQAGEDWMDRFMGSRGITASASTLMMIDAARGESTGMLRVAGRDIETDDLEMMRVGWAWRCIDRPTRLTVVQEV